jgi:hypothetical protein
VAARLDRQVILDSADPPDVSVVLEETALNRLIGSAAIMHDALAHVGPMALVLSQLGVSVVTP